LLEELARAFFTLGSEIARLDINKGVKFLWDSSVIDAGRPCWKNALSTRTESMDAQYLMKTADPEAYRQAIRSPLSKTVFRVLDPSRGWPEYLMVDASNGLVSRLKLTE
jgi:hypothetical protein